MYDLLRILARLRLRNTAALRRTGKVSFLAKCQEISDLMHFHAVSPHGCPPGSAKRVPDTVELSPFGQRQPMEENIMLIVSDETYDRTAAESVRPSSENRHTPARSGEMVESVVGRAWTRVADIGVSYP